jgi:hypothetical protein
MYPDGKTHNQMDNIQTDWRRHSSILDVRYIRDTDHYLVVSKMRERLTVIKQGSQKLHMERFNLKKLEKEEGKEKYHVQVSNRFAVLEYFDAEEGNDEGEDKNVS